MPELHWHVAALPGLLCGVGWELGFIAAVLSSISPLGACLDHVTSEAAGALSSKNHTF
jgi:hypothetical protein